MLDDGRVLDVANVIWCVGFEHAARSIELSIEQEDGWPQQIAWRCPLCAGLYFVGLPFLYSINSSLVVGVGRDAAYLADRIGSRATVGRPLETGAWIVRERDLARRFARRPLVDRPCR